MKALIVFFSILFLGTLLEASVVSPSSEELLFEYEATFYTEFEEDSLTLADQHSQHLFGYLQSPGLVSRFKLNPEIFGIGAPRLPMKLKVLREETIEGYRQITYRASGKILVNKKVEKVIAKTMKMEVHLPYDLDRFYLKKCTDRHYSSPQDFWYFYDPFREGCEHLRAEPLAKKVTLIFETSNKINQDISAGFEAIRGDNGNGDLIQITTINGFSDDSQKKKDDGRVAFEAINAWFREKGFEEKIIARYYNRPVYQFEKTLTAPDGSKKLVRVTRLLAETSSESRNVTFAKFFQRAIFEADVVIYAGHSGLGGYLDIDYLETKAGPYVFNKNKRQIFYFDGCSTYSYYLSMFEKRKPKSRVDILTNGLSSLFGYDVPVHQIFFEQLLNLKKDPTWLDVLKKMERPLDGTTFMLNVGAL